MSHRHLLKGMNTWGQYAYQSTSVMPNRWYVLKGAQLFPVNQAQYLLIVEAK